MKTNIRDFITFDSFKEYYDWRIANPAPDYKTDDKLFSDWCGVSREMEERIFELPFMTFLDKLNSHKELKPFPNSKGYSVRFASGWDVYIGAIPAKDEYENRRFEYDKKEVFFKISSSYLRFYFYRPAINEMTPEQIYEKTMSFLNAGTFEWHMVGHHRECDLSGETLYVDFLNWEPRLGKLSGIYSEFELVKEKEIDNLPKSLDIEFKTGNLIIKDWFRIDGFNKAMRDEKYDALPSINTSFGCQETTRFYATEHNMIHVSVGNSCPKVFQSKKNNTLVVGRNDDDDPLKGLKELGYVCTDLWWVTIIEEEALLGIITRANGDNEELAKLKIDEEGWDVSVKIKPGVYTLYYNTTEDFKEKAENANLDFIISNPYFALVKKHK